MTTAEMIDALLEDMQENWDLESLIVFAMDMRRELLSKLSNKEIKAQYNQIIEAQNVEN